MNSKPCSIIGELLVDFADGQLSEPLRRSVTDHLAACPDCQAELRLLERSLELAQAVWQESALPHATETQHTAVPSTLVERRRHQTPRNNVRWLATTSIATAFVACLLWSQSSPRQQEAKPGQDAVGRVEQTYAVFVRSQNEDSERPLGTRDVLHAGDRLRVAPQGGLQVRLDDGSRLWLTANTEAECVGTRSNDSPAWRLTRGEIQADITRGTKKFRIATPGGGLKVLGTEFHVRVYPDNVPRPLAAGTTKWSGQGVRASGTVADSNEKPIIKESIAMTNAANILQRAIVVLTVLSGSVAVEADGQQRTVPEGNRATCVAGYFTVDTTQVSQIDYLKKWVAERIAQPGEPSRAEVLMEVPIAQTMSRLLAVNVETGNVRHITDFVAISVKPKQIAPNLAFASIGSLCHFTTPVCGSGNPIADSTVALVDIKGSDKVALTPLREWSTDHALMSPDRRKIAFQGYRKTDGGIEDVGLYVTDMETFKPTNMLPRHIQMYPAWSPDSRWLATSQAQGYTDEGHDIVLIDTLDGTVKNTGLTGAGVKFSHDGKRLVYSGGFKRKGGWADGVPMSGNLFLATLPDGQPEQLTDLPDGGALQPTFSLDGSLVAYVESAGNDPSKVHVVDVATKKDNVVLTIKDAWIGGFQWLDNNSKFIVSYTSINRPKEDEVEVLPGAKLFQRQTDGWSVNDLKVDIRRIAKEAAEDPGVQKFAKRLMDVFVANHEGIKAEDLLQVDEAQQKYAQARDLAASIIRDLEQKSGEGVAAVKLQPSDIAPYMEAMAKKAAVKPTERSVALVRKNLEWLNSPLSGYYGLYDQFPPAEKAPGNETAPSFADWAMNPSPETMQWQINHLSGKDSERVRCMFLVPGDDPAKTATSYEVVRSGKDELVLRTPVLADGKRLEATYKLQGKVETYKQEGKERRYARVTAAIAEVK